MGASKLVLSSATAPTLEEIGTSIKGPAAALWKEANAFLQEELKALPKIAYSRCAGKPGWNVKYQKSGKSLCTLYPEREGFVALVVLPLSLLPEVMAGEREFTRYVTELAANGRPYNGTVWLMIQVSDVRVLDAVKRLIGMKLI